MTQKRNSSGLHKVLSLISSKLKNNFRNPCKPTSFENLKDTIFYKNYVL